MRRTLKYTATTASGTQLEFDFGLHPLTADAEHVSSLLTAALAAVDDFVSRDAVSDGDVLQALAMALAIRTRMVDEHGGSVHALAGELLKASLGAPARRTAAGDGMH